MSIYHIEPLDRNYNTEILKIIQSSPNITDSLTVCFDRQPDFFRLAEIRYDPCFYYGYFRLNELKGLCGIGYHDAMVNGKPDTVFHMRDYYVAHESRGLGFGLKVAEKFFRNTFKNTDTGYLVILSGNTASLGYIGHRNEAFPFMPYSRTINQQDVRNIMIVWPVRRWWKYKIRKALLADIPDVVSLLNSEHRNRLFGKLYSADTFQNYLDKRPGLTLDNYYIATDRYDRPCGVCAAWDCHEFKQTRVLNYGRRIKLSKAAYRGLSVIFGLPSLPEPGQCFKDIALTDYAVRERNPEIMHALLKAIYIEARENGYQTILFGSSADDPVLKASKGFFFQRVISNIVLISRDRDKMEPGAVRNYLPYIDIPTL
jgi:hypothetical protein